MIVAAAVLDEAQVTVLVMFEVVPLLNVPVAVNCSVLPAATEEFAGVTAIEVSVTVLAVTLRLVDPEMPPLVAEMLADWPAVTPFASPAELIVAAVVLDEAHVTELVMFDVDPSPNVPVAVNWSVLPAATEEFAGVTAIDVSVSEVTEWLGEVPAQLAKSTRAKTSDNIPDVRTRRVTMRERNPYRGRERIMTELRFMFNLVFEYLNGEAETTRR